MDSIRVYTVFSGKAAMATAEQIKSLIRSHLDGDKERFATIALQLAAHYSAWRFSDKNSPCF